MPTDDGDAPLTFPIFCDDDLSVWNAFGMSRFKPQAVVIDRNMMIQFADNEFRAAEDAMDMVEDLLGS